MSELQGLKLLRRIEEGVAGKSGEAFFRQIVQDIAGALNAHAAFSSRLLPDRRAAMLAFWVDGRYERCLEYSLEGTPCEFVYNGRISGFARDIGNIFPADRAWFEELGVNSYLGIPIADEKGEVFGHLAVMDRPERDWHDADVDILRLFSLRAAVELERDRAHRQLAESVESSGAA
jgi:GAF domain-containing protein